MKRIRNKDPFKKSAIWRGEGSNFIETCQDSSKKLPTEVQVKNWKRPRWMVPELENAKMMLETIKVFLIWLRLQKHGKFKYSDILPHF